LKAAVVSDIDRPPKWATFEDPTGVEGESIVAVSAAALSPLVRARASGAHYSAAKGVGSFVAGVDGVGRLPDGRRVYFAFPPAPFGAMAQRVSVRTNLHVAVPDGVDDVTAAAIANPGMSSWAALLERARLAKGEAVLVNGATGTAGRLAIQIAKYLGAKTLIATGRSAQQLERLGALGADATISLALPNDELERALEVAIFDNDVTIVLDYLWGNSAESILKAIARNDTGPVARRIRFVQIGAVSGSEISLAASTLRSTRVELLGSGLRSVSNERLVELIGGVMRAVEPAKLQIDTVSRPMDTVETAWNEDCGTRRLVFTLPS
jgi:NADPH:quinone reductase-like Zn-dependent oxidoreductase